MAEVHLNVVPVLHVEDVHLVKDENFYGREEVKVAVSVPATMTATRSARCGTSHSRAECEVPRSEYAAVEAIPCSLTLFYYESKKIMNRSFVFQIVYTFTRNLFRLPIYHLPLSTSRLPIYHLPLSILQTSYLSPSIVHPPDVLSITFHCPPPDFLSITFHCPSFRLPIYHLPLSTSRLPIYHLPLSILQTSYLSPSIVHPSDVLSITFHCPSFRLPIYQLPLSILQTSYLSPSIVHPSDFLSITFHRSDFLSITFHCPSFRRPIYHLPLSILQTSCLSPSIVHPSYLSPSIAQSSYLSPSIPSDFLSITFHCPSFRLPVYHLPLSIL